MNDWKREALASYGVAEGTKNIPYAFMAGIEAAVKHLSDMGVDYNAGMIEAHHMITDLEQRLHEANMKSAPELEQKLADYSFKINVLNSANFQLATDKKQLEQRLKEVSQELEQQRFNNKHNLSIDQTIADKIKDLEQRLKEAESDSSLKSAVAMYENLRMSHEKLTERLKEAEAVISKMPTSFHVPYCQMKVGDNGGCCTCHIQVLKDYINAKKK